MKILKSLLMALSAILILSCGGKQTATPGSVAKNLYEELAKGNAKVLLEAGETDKDEIEMAEALGAKFKDAVDKQGGIKNIEILEETISDNGKSANVKLKIIYGDGTTKTEKQKMELEDGQWRCILSLF